MSPSAMLASLLGLAAVASAHPADLRSRFPGVIHEHDVRSPDHPNSNTDGEIGALASRLIPVVVGGAQSLFVPNIVRASVGDIVQFQFSAGNHTVTQSAEGAPCVALQAQNPAAIHSGHIPYTAGQANVGTFNMPVTSSEPMFLFCATGPHCQTGQVMMINPTNDQQLVNYAKAAAGAKQTVDGGPVSGGQLAQIPIGAAAFVPPPPEEAAPGGAAPGGGAAAPAPAPAKPVTSSSARTSAATTARTSAASTSAATTTAAAAKPAATSSAAAAPVAAAPPAHPAAAPPAGGAPAALPSGPKTTLTLFARGPEVTQAAQAL
ncbi:hypothetical protein Micbo1qcDRAFT_215141 [Microdochium bolleyi]|uniref:Cupredoxin n=1 Tax=Microdochium bolleyi TaxID=196109 RepID=A0A136ISV3_9PEZI|nr:hypothetical protein Micbo1qcDRAFT_215141 [Microdochium bolleyi]